MSRRVAIALAGNPNTGKTSIFNALTGSRQHTGNWPGKTVLKRHGDETRAWIDNTAALGMLSCSPATAALSSDRSECVSLLSRADTLRRWVRIC